MKNQEFAGFSAERTQIIDRMNKELGRTAPKGPVTSPSLLIRVRDASDEESWEMFCRLYGPIIQSFCRSKGFQQSDIDDICQDALAKVALAIRTFEYDPAKGKFRSWLATITANKLKDFVRQNKSRNIQLVDAIEGFAECPGENKEWSSLFLKRVLIVACDRIRPRFADDTWYCFESTWLNSQSPVEVADHLGIPVHSVYVNKSRVMKQLEEEIKLLSEDCPELG